MGLNHSYEDLHKQTSLRGKMQELFDIPTAKRTAALLTVIAIAIVIILVFLQMNMNVSQPPISNPQQILHRAVEITVAKVTPDIMDVGDESRILVEVEYLGNSDNITRPARNVVLSIEKVGETKNHIILDGGNVTCVERKIGDLLSGNVAQEVFEITAPEDCYGSFDLKVSVSYDYKVDSVGNIFIIDQDRFEELIEQDKFVVDEQVTRSTSGPVSVNIMTNFPQPIPVKNGKEFALYVIIENFRSSNAIVTVKNIEISIPPQFSPVDGGKCEFCRIKNDSGTTDDWGDVRYSLKELHGINFDNPVCEISVDEKNHLALSGDIEKFKCEMIYHPVQDDMLYFKKPMNVQVEVDYGYEYTKDVSFTVRKGVNDDNSLQRCNGTDFRG